MQHLVVRLNREKYYRKNAILKTIKNCATKFRFNIMETQEKVQILKYLHTFQFTIRFLYINPRNRRVNSLRRCRSYFSGEDLSRGSLRTGLKPGDSSQDAGQRIERKIQKYLQDPFAIPYEEGERSLHWGRQKERK